MEVFCILKYIKDAEITNGFFIFLCNESSIFISLAIIFLVNLTIDGRVRCTQHHGSCYRNHGIVNEGEFDFIMLEMYCMPEYGNIALCGILKKPCQRHC